MLPNNKIEVYSFQRVCRRCARAHHACSCGPRVYLDNPQRALDSRWDLFDSSGRNQRAPDINLPIAAVGASDPTNQLVEAFRAVVTEPCDRISVYLLSSRLQRQGQPTQKPTQMFLDIRLGEECVEESLVTFLFSPGSFQDGGHLVTFATPQLWTSMVILGNTISAVAGVVPQSVSLNLKLDRIGICCTQIPLFGQLVDRPNGPQ